MTTIIEAIEDPKLLRPYLSNGTGRLRSWRPWLEVLGALYGVPTKSKAFVNQCTGRDPRQLPREGFGEALFITGRRSGKSRIAAAIAAYEAAISGRHERLHAGEQGLIPVISPTLRQSQVVRKYIRHCFASSPLLAAEVVDEQQSGFTLKSGVRIETIAGDWRSVRGYTLLTAIVDEAAFFGQDDQGRIKNDTELFQALTPGLLTTGGKLVAITTPYSRHGWCYKTWEDNFGNDAGDTLVWQAASKTMNFTLPQAFIDKQMRKDPAKARAEFYAEWRDDVNSFISRETVMECVRKGRTALPPMPGRRYVAFVDMSGGRGDDACLAIAHRDENVVVIDKLFRWQPPFDPSQVIHQMIGHLRRFGVRKITGDAYGAEFTSRGFEINGVRYTQSKLNKSELYLELLPQMTSGEVELLDDETLIDQLCRLERRTRAGGKDTIDHPKGCHDDLANVVAGVVVTAIGAKKTIVGAF